MTPRLPTFSVSSALAYASKTLSEPPKWEHVERVAGVGELVARFVLPLELCQTSNARMRGGLKQRFAEAAIKRKTYELMRIQNGGRNFDSPLSGRPQVLAVRFSSREADATSDWSKSCVDRLLVVKNGLGLLRDDSPKWASVKTWCEHAEAGKGFVLLMVFSGDKK